MLLYGCCVCEICLGLSNPPVLLCSLARCLSFLYVSVSHNVQYVKRSLCLSDDITLGKGHSNYNNMVEVSGRPWSSSHKRRQRAVSYVKIRFFLFASSTVSPLLSQHNNQGRCVTCRFVALVDMNLEFFKGQSLSVYTIDKYT